MGMFDFLDPSRGTQRYLNDIPGQLNEYMGPFRQAGLDALNPLRSQYSQLLNNPGQFMNQIGGSYQQSPGFQFAVQQALQGAGNAAAAGGMAGSPQHQQQNMTLATNLANQDYNNWLRSALGLYGRGLSGQENLYNIGAHTGQEMGNDMAQMLMSQAMMKYAGNAGRNQAVGGLLGNVGGLLGGAGGLLGGAAGGLLSGVGGFLFGK